MTKEMMKLWVDSGWAIFLNEEESSISIFNSDDESTTIVTLISFQKKVDSSDHIL